MHTHAHTRFQTRLGSTHTRLERDRTHKSISNPWCAVFWSDFDAPTGFDRDQIFELLWYLGASALTLLAFSPKHSSPLARIALTCARSFSNTSTCRHAQHRASSPSLPAHLTCSPWRPLDPTAYDFASRMRPGIGTFLRHILLRGARKSSAHRLRPVRPLHGSRVAQVSSASVCALGVNVAGLVPPVSWRFMNFAILASRPASCCASCLPTFLVCLVSRLFFLSCAFESATMAMLPHLQLIHDGLEADAARAERQQRLSTQSLFMRTVSVSLALSLGVVCLSTPILVTAGHLRRRVPKSGLEVGGGGGRGGERERRPAGVCGRTGVWLRR